MSSYGETQHAKFIKGQEEHLRYLYRALPAEELNPYEVAYRDEVFCSPTYVRKIFRTFSDYKEKCSKRRSRETTRQYKDGTRSRNIAIAGWKPQSREQCGKRGLSQERFDQIIELFHSDLQIKDISAKTKAKHETIVSIWKENFSEQELENRLYRTWRTAKPPGEVESEIVKYFHQLISCRELGKKFNTHGQHITRIFIKHFGLKAYKTRAEQSRKNGILNSLTITGKNGHTGSRPENHCFKLLKEKLGDIVVHHDLDTLPPFEIDITIPSKKVAICWDGPFHREPIFGHTKLARVQKRDGRKHRELLKMGWRILVIEDNDKAFNPTFVQQKVQEILQLIEADFQGKQILC